MTSLMGCNKEQIPVGLLLQDELNTTDTTYMISNIPSAQTKKIFVEEATGVRCANCPSGALILRNLKLTYPDKIISASIYSPFLNYFQPTKFHILSITSSSSSLSLNSIISLQNFSLSSTSTYQTPSSSFKLTLINPFTSSTSILQNSST